MEKVIIINILLSIGSVSLTDPEGTDQNHSNLYDSTNQYSSIPNENFNGFAKELDRNLISNPEDQFSLYQGLKESDHQTPYHYDRAELNNYGFEAVSEDISVQENYVGKIDGDYVKSSGPDFFSSYYDEIHTPPEGSIRSDLKMDVRPLQSIFTDNTPQVNSQGYGKDPPSNYNVRNRNIDRFTNGLDDFPKRSDVSDRPLQTGLPLVDMMESDGGVEPLVDMMEGYQAHDNHIQQIFSLSQLPTEGSRQRDADEPPNYEFAYQIQQTSSNLHFSHTEEREGDTTTGTFSILLPDGRTQIVDYISDKRGYRPKIRYEGEPIKRGQTSRQNIRERIRQHRRGVVNQPKSR